jgi:hypothetical protein
MQNLSERPRFKLFLGKFPVVRVVRTSVGLDMALELPGLGKLIVGLPAIADVREGDLLTLYTEVLANANPIPPSIQ